MTAAAPSTRPRLPLLQAILVLHGAVTVAAALVLVCAPAAIPATVGMSLTREEFLLPYLLAGAQLAVGVLSLGAPRVSDRAALRLILGTFVVFHVATAALEVMYLLQVGVAPVLAANAVVRVLVAAVLGLALRSLGSGTART